MHIIVNEFFRRDLLVKVCWMNVNAVLMSPFRFYVTNFGNEVPSSAVDSAIRCNMMRSAIELMTNSRLMGICV